MHRRTTRIVLNGLTLLACIGAAGLMLAIVLRPVPEQSSVSSAAIGGPFTLIDTRGETVTDRTYRGKWLLIYFGYTFCPDVCPTSLSNMSAALEKLGPEADEIKPIFITVDPRRDTPHVLAAYLQSFDSRIVGLTGSQAQTDSAAKAYRVYVAPQNGDGKTYSVDHSSYFYVMDPQGKFVNVIAGDVTGDRMVDKLSAMIRQPRA